MVVKSILQVKLSAIIKLVIKWLVGEVQVGCIGNQMLNQTHLDVYLTCDTSGVVKGGARGGDRQLCSRPFSRKV